MQRIGNPPTYVVVYLTIQNINIIFMPEFMEL